ncbi:MAG: DUF721 domain-containing protein [Candidatus Margulisbacteria bacterium]|nr:DUF721 domain-containing protein [Candidatus Margulisiibacteriota bacterium]
MKPMLLKEIVEKISEKNIALKKSQEWARLEKEWGQIVGAELANQCYPEKIKNKILWLSVSSSTWAQQLHFYQNEIKEKINTFFYKDIVQDIRCQANKPSMLKKSEILSYQAEAPSLQDLAQKEAALAEIVKEKELLKRLAFLWSKAKKFFKNNALRQQSCKQCGKTYRGTNPAICLNCEEKNKQHRRELVAKLLKEVPWATFESLRKELKTIGEPVFFQIKEELRRKKYDTLRQAIFAYLKQNQPQQGEALKRQILEYVALRSGLTPDKINDKIIQEILGNRKTRLLKLKGVRI